MIQAEVVESDWVEIRSILLKVSAEKIASFEPCSSTLSDDVCKYVKVCISDLNDVSVQTTSAYGVLVLRFCYEAACAANFSRAWNAIVEAEKASEETPEEEEPAKE